MRVKTDPKLMNNPDAQCTAYYLDFFKCADACVRHSPKPDHSAAPAVHRSLLCPARRPLMLGREPVCRNALLGPG